MPQPQAFVAQPADHLSPLGTRVVVDGVGLLGLGTLLVLALVRRSVHRRRMMLAHRSALKQSEPLHRGPSVLAGTVVEENEGDAIVVAIEQVGREWRNKSSWHHQWKETRRKVDVRPFYVQRQNGERVRVEPDDRVFLVDKLDGTDRMAPNLRVRRARLTPGEHVFILGQMTRAPDPKLGGYRESAEGWVLRPPRDARMLVSTEPLEDRHQRRTKLWRNIALVSAGLMLFWHCFLFAEVYLFRCFSHPIVATAVGKNRWIEYVSTKHGPQPVHHFRVNAVTSDGRELMPQVDARSYELIDAGTPLTFLVADRDPRLVQIGAHACASADASVFGLMLALSWLVLYNVWAVTTLPWWERRLLVENGKGRL